MAGWLDLGGWGLGRERRGGGGEERGGGKECRGQDGVERGACVVGIAIPSRASCMHATGFGGRFVGERDWVRSARSDR